MEQNDSNANVLVSELDSYGLEIAPILATHEDFAAKNEGSVTLMLTIEEGASLHIRLQDGEFYINGRRIVKSKDVNDVTIQFGKGIEDFAKKLLHAFPPMEIDPPQEDSETGNEKGRGDDEGVVHLDVSPFTGTKQISTTPAELEILFSRKHTVGEFEATVLRGDHFLSPEEKERLRNLTKELQAFAKEKPINIIDYQAGLTTHAADTIHLDSLSAFENNTNYKVHQPKVRKNTESIIHPANKKETTPMKPTKESLLLKLVEQYPALSYFDFIDLFKTVDSERTDVFNLHSPNAHYHNEGFLKAFATIANAATSDDVYFCFNADKEVTSEHFTEMNKVFELTKAHLTGDVNTSWYICKVKSFSYGALTVANDLLDTLGHDTRISFSFFETVTSNVTGEDLSLLSKGVMVDYKNKPSNFLEVDYLEFDTKQEPVGFKVLSEHNTRGIAGSKRNDFIVANLIKHEPELIDGFFEPFLKHA